MYRYICVSRFVSGVHGPCSGVYVRVSDAAVPRGAFGEAAGNDDAEVAVSLLSREGPPGEYRHEAQVMFYRKCGVQLY